MAKTEIERLEEELRHKKERNDRLRAQTNRLLKDKQANFEKLYWDHKESEKEFDWQREKLKEAQAEIKEKNESLMSQEKFFEETNERMREGNWEARRQMVVTTLLYKLVTKLVIY